MSSPLFWHWHNFPSELLEIDFKAWNNSTFVQYELFKLFFFFLIKLYYLLFGRIQWAPDNAFPFKATVMVSGCSSIFMYVIGLIVSIWSSHPHLILPLLSSYSQRKQSRGTLGISWNGRHEIFSLLRRKERKGSWRNINTV